MVKDFFPESLTSAAINKIWAAREERPEGVSANMDEAQALLLHAEDETDAALAVWPNVKLPATRMHTLVLAAAEIVAAIEEELRTT